MVGVLVSGRGIDGRHKWPLLSIRQVSPACQMIGFPYELLARMSQTSLDFLIGLKRTACEFFTKGRVKRGLT